MNGKHNLRGSAARQPLPRGSLAAPDLVHERPDHLAWPRLSPPAAGCQEPLHLCHRLQGEKKNCEAASEKNYCRRGIIRDGLARGARLWKLLVNNAALSIS